MFWSLVSLFVLIGIIRLVIMLAKGFMAWLGRGKPIQRAAENRELPDDVREAAARLDFYYRL